MKSLIIPSAARDLVNVAGEPLERFRTPKSKQHARQIRADGIIGSELIMRFIATEREGELELLGIVCHVEVRLTD